MPCETIHIDLCGPSCNSNVILALIDEYSRWPELHVFQGDPSALQIAYIELSLTNNIQRLKSKSATIF